MSTVDLSMLIKPGDRVWLVPKTLGAPAICFTSPAAEVAALDLPYVVAVVAGREHRVHVDNVRRTDPTTPGRERVPRVRKPMPDGFSEVTCGDFPIKVAPPPTPQEGQHPS